MVSTQGSCEEITDAYCSTDEENASTEEEDNAVVAFDAANGGNKPTFGNVAVSNSTDVHFGDKTFYQGPVTIKQFLYANSTIGKDASQLENGVVFKENGEVTNERYNPSFVGEDFLVKDCDVGAPRKVDPGITHLQKEKGTHWHSPTRRQYFLIAIGLGVTVLLSLTTLAAVLLSKHTINGGETTAGPGSSASENDANNVPIDAPSDGSFNVTLPPKVKVVSRLEWLAQPPVEPATPLNLPVPYVIISHTATESCASQAQCIFHVRFIQTYHIESRNWWDIGYNFLVGGDGEVYEGRGWKGEGAHTFNYNAKSIGIAFIGTFNSVTPPERQFSACKKLIAMGVDKGYVAKDYKLLAARQLQTTQSPGKMVYDEIKTWPHWAPSP